MKNFSSHKRSRQGGFTLPEMIVVIAVITILLGISLAAVNSARKKAALTRAVAETEGIATGAYLYYQDNKRWATDIGNGVNTDFYNTTYVPTAGDEPSTYLGPNYHWDWQNWGRDDSGPNGTVFPKQPADLMCWQSVDLYRGEKGNVTTNGAHLVIRRCLNNTCYNQLYCDNNGDCYDTAEHRDLGGGPGSPWYLRKYKGGSGYVSPICEECFNEADCAKQFQPN